MHLPAATIWWCSAWRSGVARSLFFRRRVRARRSEPSAYHARPDRLSPDGRPGIMTWMPPVEPPSSLYLESSPIEKLRRERYFHVVEVPRLRLLGFAIVTLLVMVRRIAMPDEPDAHPLLLAAFVLGYSVVSWAILYVFFERVRGVNLGTVFLSLDIVAFVVAIYLTGGEKSWLFYLLFIRTADQTNTNFRRALAFAHLSVALYAGLLFELAFVEHRSVSWAAEVFKLLLLYGGNLYIAMTARTAERLRNRIVAAIRYARDLV